MASNSNPDFIPFPQRDANGRPTARERITPQSLEAEQSTLGAMILERDSIARAIESLTVDDFYRNGHRNIFKAILTLFDKGEPVDLITLVEELRRRNQLEELGGVAYLTALIEACPSAANVEAYAKVVQEKSVLRQLLSASEQISTWAYGEVEDISHLVDQSERKIFEIGSRQLRDGFSPIKQLLMAAYDQIERQFQHKGEATGISTGFIDLDDITSGLQATDLIIVAARPSMGKCVSRYAKVIDVETGALVTVEECVQRRLSSVLNVSRSGQLQKSPVSDWIDSGIKPCFRVTTRLGRSVEVTGHHPFLTVHGWMPLHDLSVGNKIAIPRSVPVFGSNETMPLDRVRLLAYFIAEGGLTGAVPKWTNADPGLVEDFKAAISGQFPELLVKEEPTGIDFKIVRPHRGKGMAPNRATSWLRDMGLMGKGAADKSFPSCAWTWSRRYLAEFLQVLFSCDGTIYKLGDYPRIEFAVASKQLAEDVQHALLRFGIIAKLWRKKERYWRVEITDPASVLRFNVEIGWVGEKATRFCDVTFTSRALPRRVSNAGHPPKETWELVRQAAKRHGLSLSGLARKAGETDKTGKCAGYNAHTRRGLPAHRLMRYAEILQDPALLRIASPDLYWDEIISIEPIGEQQVYDLTVPDGSNFIANDVCVHNTALCLNIAHHIALKERLPVAIFSLEMSKEQLVQRLICSEAMINSRDLRRGFLQDSDWHRVTNAVNNLYQAPIFIDDTPAATTFEMRAKARRLTAEHGQLGLIVVDYLQLAHHAGKNENRVQEISEIARAFKSMARELKVPLIALSQLSRAVETREDKRPILSDLRESGCVTGDTLVYLPDTGVSKPIAQLEHLSGFRVLALNEKTWKMEPRAVERAFCTGTKPVWKMTLTSGRVIRATGNHRFRAFDSWKRLDEIQVGQHLALPRRTFPMTAQDTMSQAELALLGHLIGDGSTLEKRGSYYTSGEEELAQAVVNLSKEVFGDTINPRLRLDARERYEVGLISSTPLTHGKHNAAAQWLRDLGAWDHRSWQKRVPNRVFAQSDAGIATFLRHLWSTDGCYHVKKCGEQRTPFLYYASNSETLARGVQSLLLRLGIQSMLREVNQGSKGRPVWNVVVTGQGDARRFLDTIGAFGARRQEIASRMRDLIATQGANTNRDVIPRDAWRSIVVPTMSQTGMTTRAMQAAIGMHYCGNALYKANLSRERAARVAKVVGSSELTALAESDVYWDRVLSIEPDGEEAVYDLTVEGLHNFVANDLIVHNSIEAEADIVAFIYRPSYYKNKQYKKGKDDPPSNDEPDPDEGIAEVIIGKQRNGPVGTIRLGFQPDFARFTNLVSNHYDGYQ